MGIVDRFRGWLGRDPGKINADVLRPRLEGWTEGHTTLAYDARLEREGPVDTREFLCFEAQWILDQSRIELRRLAELEKERPGEFLIHAGVALPGYWWIGYSAGIPLPKLAESIEEFLDQCAQKDALYQRRYPELPNNRIEDVGGGEGYWRTLDHLGWLVGFGATQEQLARYLAVTGVPGQDALFDRIVAALGFSRPVADRLILERDYKDTLALFDDPEPKRSARLVRIMKSWLRSRWHDFDPAKPGEPRYVGLWATDVALVVMALGLDDSACRGMPHYPADLVDYYRSLAAR